MPQDKTVCRELLAEAEFYQVVEIVHDLRVGSLQDSSILSSDQCKTLITWLIDTWNQKKGNLFPCLLYRASWNGWSADNFHSCCDRKGATVIVVKAGNYRHLEAAPCDRGEVVEVGLPSIGDDAAVNW